MLRKILFAAAAASFALPAYALDADRPTTIIGKSGNTDMREILQAQPQPGRPAIAAPAFEPVSDRPVAGGNEKQSSLKPICRPWPPFGLLCTAGLAGDRDAGVKPGLSGGAVQEAGFNWFSWRAVPFYYTPLGGAPDATPEPEDRLLVAGGGLSSGWQGSASESFQQSRGQWSAAEPKIQLAGIALNGID